MQDMMRAMTDAQDELEDLEVQGTSGGGVVRVTANCVPEIRRVEISTEALEDPDMLGDLIVVAVNDALHNAAQAAAERMGGFGNIEDLAGSLGGMLFGGQDTEGPAVDPPRELE